MAALQAFRAEPELRSVRVSCVEAFGEHPVPSDAEIYFQGVDEQVGSLVKYARREPDGHA